MCEPFGFAPSDQHLIEPVMRPFPLWIQTIALLPGFGNVRDLFERNIGHAKTLLNYCNNEASRAQPRKCLS